MTTLPAPTTAPSAFLRALLAQGDRKAAAEEAGCNVHRLTDTPGTDAAAMAALQAAGARAIAATLAREARPILLISQGSAAGAEYAQALAQGLMGYERIHALVCGPTGESGAVEVTGDSANEGLRLILILPPTVENTYWQR